MKPRPTLLDQMQRTSGRSSGFDYMRTGLATAIICLHSVTTSYGMAAQDALWGSIPGRPLTLLAPMFFALSGFLVAGSWERCRTLVSFLGLRVLRIFPALSAQVALSALIIGPLVTTLPLGVYFRDPLFLRFFWNAVGHTQYLLPGVFTYNPIRDVNGQLWTVPYELDCYLILTALALVGVVKRRWLLLLGLAAVQLFLAFHAFFRPHGDAVGMSGPLIGLCFMWGLCFHRFRDRVPFGGGLGLAALLLSVGLMILPDGKYLAPLPVAYGTVCLGLLDPPRDRLVLSGDYSYGLYVFGYPIQQLIATQPALRDWRLNLLIGLPLAFAVAALSWRLVESRALGLRGRLVDLESRLIALSRRVRRSAAILAPAAMVDGVSAEPN
jgi:peptidoglycan/LPS O-acetylase OafA/YrhL